MNTPASIEHLRALLDDPSPRAALFLYHAAQRDFAEYFKELFYAQCGMRTEMPAETAQRMQLWLNGERP